MTVNEDNVFKLLRSNDNLWLKVFEELTDRRIGGYIPQEDLYPWIDKNLYRPILLDSLETGQYQWSIARKVCLIKPGSTKKRVVYIYSYRDRLVQALLCRAIATLYAHKVHPKCYSYRSGVSTVSAVKDVFMQINNRNMYSVKLDISSYFYNVRRNDIKAQLDALFSKDGRLHKLLTNLYFDDRLFDRQEHGDREANEHEARISEAMHGRKGKNHIIKNEYKSLIAGSSLSGFMSNCLLYALDDFISGLSGVVYARYCDDILVAHESKERLAEVFDHIQQHLASMGLEMNGKKVNWYKQDDTITFLGIQTFIRDGVRVYDVGMDTVMKLKKFIKKAASKARLKIEKKKLTGTKKELVMVKLCMKINHLLYKCYIEDKRKFGWAYYAFRCINTIDSLKAIDFYLCDTLRWVWTGKHNKYNVKAVPKERLIRYGFVSLVDMYNYFRTDFDLYKNVVYQITDGVVSDVEYSEVEVYERYMKIMSNPYINRTGLYGVATYEES